MARFKSTTFGSISGRHGTAVASTMKDGTGILRVYNPPTNPNTPAQQAQRSKFGFVNSELSPLRDIFKNTFRSNRGMNIAVSHVLKNAVIGVAPDYEVDYTQLMFASGSIQFPDQISAEVTTGNSVSLTWDTTLRKEDEFPDFINLVFMNQDSKFTILRENVALRSSGTATHTLPEIWEGKQVYCWAYFSTPESKLTSVSRYIALLQL